MARGNLHAASSLLLPHDNAHGRRGRDPGVDHVAARLREGGGDHGGQHESGGPTVAADHDRPGGQRLGKGQYIANGDCGCKAVPHDAAEPGNANDEGVGHDRGVPGQRWWAAWQG